MPHKHHNRKSKNIARNFCRKGEHVLLINSLDELAGIAKDYNFPAPNKTNTLEGYRARLAQFIFDTAND